MDGMVRFRRGHADDDDGRNRSFWVDDPSVLVVMVFEMGRVVVVVVVLSVVVVLGGRGG